MNQVKTSPRTAPLYDTDYYAWTQEQAARLRDVRPNSIDWENVAEEVAGLGRSEKRAIRSDLSVLLLHLLKWRCQPAKRKSGWRGSIREHRRRIAEEIVASPSLRRYPGEVLQEVYEFARSNAEDETGVGGATIPEKCPFTIEEVLDPAFYPDLPGR